MKRSVSVLLAAALTAPMAGCSHPETQTTCYMTTIDHDGASDVKPAINIVLTAYLGVGKKELESGSFQDRERTALAISKTLIEERTRTKSKLSGTGMYDIISFCLEAEANQSPPIGGIVSPGPLQKAIDSFDRLPERFTVTSKAVFVIPQNAQDLNTPAELIYKRPS